MKAIAMAILACSLTACLAEDLAPPTTDPAPLDRQSDTLANPAAQASLAGDVQTGAVETPDATASQNCVFIQWCDQPNSSNGTVCIVRSSSTCQSQCVNGLSSAVIAECNSDAKAVCGGIVPQARIFCHE
jgi:hypothetical protein